jgi:two-component system KDP operon response regulator KdpE
MSTQGGSGRVLVVDDEPAILRALRIGLRADGYEVAVAPAGEPGLALAVTFRPDVVVLDLSLPDLDGVGVCRELRRFSDAPIVVLSAHGGEERKVEALDAGADDFVTKPFGMAELSARLRVAFRHRRALQEAGVADRELTVGILAIDLATREVRVAGEPVVLTVKELELLIALARRPGRVLRHRALLREVWGPSYGAETHYLRVYANRVRRKLGPEAARMLRTLPGVGYRLVDPSDLADDSRADEVAESRPSPGD